MAEVDLATLAIRIQSQEAEAAKKRLNDLGTEAEKTEAKTETLAQSTVRLVSRFAQLAAVGATVTQFLRFSVASYVELDAATANLAAKTGLAGDALGLMVERAKELSGATTQTAASILDAAEQVEGLVPRLAGNAEAISEVTRQAVILAEATGDELQPSVAAVGQALAQFGGGAEDAARYANALVAAAQNGAAEVQDLAGAMERVGPAASRAGVSFEQTLAAMELLANRGIRGREAVGGLKEFFDKLATSTETQYNPALVGLDQALANLAAANLTAAERTKFFGDAAADVAGVIVGSQGEFNTLSGEITGTNAALDQANERLKSLEAQAEIAKNQVTLLGQEVGGVLAPYLAEAARAGGQMAQVLRDAIDAENDASDASRGFGEVLNLVTLTLAGFAQAIGAVIDAGQLFMGWALSAANFLSGNFKDSIDTASSAWQDYADKTNERVNELVDAYARLDQARAGNALGTPSAAAGSGYAEDPDAMINAVVAAEERRLAAEREARAVRIAEEQETEQKRLDYLEDIRLQFEDDVQEANQRLMDDQLEQKEREYQTEVEYAERLAAWKEEHQAELAERMKAWFETDLERTMEQYQLREDAINEFYDSVSFPNEEERQERLRKLIEQKETDITEIFRRGAFTRAQFAVASTKNQTVGVLSELENMTRGIAQHNKAAFQVNKAAAIAEALIAMPEHVSKTMAKYPFPLSVAMGALAAASSLAQINAIRSATFEGGGGGTTPSLAGSGGVVNGNPVQPDTAPPPQIGGTAQGQGSETRVFIVGAGQLMTDREVADILGRVKGLVDDGDFTLASGNSRQALDFARAGI